MRKDPKGVAMAEVNGAELEDLITAEDSAIVVYFCESKQHFITKILTFSLNSCFQIISLTAQHVSRRSILESESKVMKIRKQKLVCPIIF